MYLNVFIVFFYAVLLHAIRHTYIHTDEYPVFSIVPHNQSTEWQTNAEKCISFYFFSSQFYPFIKKYASLFI